MLNIESSFHFDFEKKSYVVNYFFFKKFRIIIIIKIDIYVQIYRINKKGNNMKEKIENIVINAVIEIGETTKNSNLISANKSTRLYGRDGNLDSLSLIRLAIIIEENLSDELDLEVSIVDDKAMSQTRSPFRDVQSLIDYIVSICEL